MTLTMLSTGEKVPSEQSTYVVSAEPSLEKPRGIQKKHVLIAVSAVVIVGLVIAAILVGMYMFSEANKEIVKFSLQFKTGNGENANQDVVSDPNDNVVMFHVNKPGQDVYVVNDFNKDLQVVKVETIEATNCYISALNRSQAMDPSQITGSASLTGSNGQEQQPYSISGTPVKDTTFMTKKARDMCKGVSVYWAYRSCGGNNVEGQNQNITAPDRNKRTIYVMNPVYGMYGLGGCCRAYYACELTMVETVQGSYHTCQTYYRTGTCCGRIAYPYCTNLYWGTWNTPGLVC